MHPLFTAEAIAAQKRLPEIQGADGIWYAGAWQRYGFHEDGLLSAVRVAESLGAVAPVGRRARREPHARARPRRRADRRHLARAPLGSPAPETSS